MNIKNLEIPKYFGVEEGKNSAIRLGYNFVADGLDRKRESLYRIQSHTHSDHLNNWKEHIKPGKRLILSQPSKEILMIDEKHIKRRANIDTPKNDTPLIINNNGEEVKIKLLDAKHIPGSVQCRVEYSNGDVFGYSGDIGEGVDKVVKADYLIMDTAYTKFSQGSNRKWDREKAFESFLEIIEERIHIGPVHIYARTGMLQEAVQYLERHSEKKFTYVATEKIIKLNNLFKRWGQTLPEVVEDISTFESSSSSNLIFLRPYESKGNETLESTVIDISNFSAPNESPIKTISASSSILSVQICISNHVHGDMLKNYIEQTGAKFIITDTSRSNKQKAERLSGEIRNSLNISSKAAHEIDYWQESKKGLYG